MLLFKHPQNLPDPNIIRWEIEEKKMELRNLRKPIKNKRQR